MSNGDDEIKVKEEFVKTLAESLDINVENIYHFILSNGTELIGEIVPSEFDSNMENSFAALHEIHVFYPIKIIRDSWVDADEQYSSNNFFVNWNPCISVPFVPIFTHHVISPNIPNTDTIYSYMTALQNIYFPPSIHAEIPTVSESKNPDFKSSNISRDNNVVSFMEYKNKRIK